ncbi:NrfD/PsrC family molybdoenzyme membrane anchor subunit [Planctomicrobium piriforme]|uniref:Prokaryotic molybdopterin-containing oxidoreductase family, membrane subunit n=1 Tax=Planctomicrobium piriforme TaxID=1576369 RepID=A0A1I3JF73_9PLAN|nr:NrfD/PsrC family molybdoenzyme membrane anchor subunit [Planctomicrobium piriforme]SFI58796.1 prokaryotic molybdopterin-containing oxidoreductase family, membrane subunit [Planctomicrobium piriforme]
MTDHQHPPVVDHPPVPLHPHDTAFRQEPGPPSQIASVSDQISSIVLQPGLHLGWLAGFAFSFCLLQMMLVSIAWLLIKGTGVWGVNIPIGWGFAIVNFVWWVGIGHAGTLISAILLLFRQEWRTSINRFAEAMTLFAVACAGVFPGVHIGRPWFAYWLAPYPNTMGVWPQFRSPLLWDVFAISTYATVSLLFWYVGLIPDLATLRDRAKNKPAQIIYGMMSMGWRGSARHWKRYTDAYLLLAGLATPLVLSVHTIVSFDFAVSQVPGWHATIFPPYFVAGAIFSGFAMVLTIAIPLRSAYHLKAFLTDWHLDNMAKVMLAAGLVVAYGYVFEHFIAWYSDHAAEKFMLWNRMTGPYWWSYWMLMLCNIAIPQLLWSYNVRHNVYALFIISIIINIGMWLERFVIVVTSLHRDYLPSSWGMYYPTIWDWSLYIGSMGLFATLLFLFIRVLPVISIFEMREQVHHEGEE